MSGNNLTLDGSSHGPLTIMGIYTAPDNTDTFISGTLNNTGLIQMTTAGNNAVFVMNGPVTLQGGGTLTMTESRRNERDQSGERRHSNQRQQFDSRRGADWQQRIAAA